MFGSTQPSRLPPRGNPEYAIHVRRHGEEQQENLRRAVKHETTIVQQANFVLKTELYAARHRAAAQLQALQASHRWPSCPITPHITPPSSPCHLSVSPLFHTQHATSNCLLTAGF